MKRTIPIIRCILLLMVSAAFLMSAYAKLTSNPQALAMLGELNLGAYRSALGIIEIIIVLCLWWRPTRMIGTLIASAYLGGAIASELSLGSTAINPAITLGLVWLAGKLSWWTYGCRNCCSDCKDGTCTTHLDEKEKCRCKPGCECDKGACSC